MTQQLVSTPPFSENSQVEGTRLNASGIPPLATLLSERLPQNYSEEVARLLRELDADRYAVRQRARQRLSAIPGTNATLWEALSSDSSNDVRNSVATILAQRITYHAAPILRDKRALAELGVPGHYVDLLTDRLKNRFFQGDTEEIGKLLAQAERIASAAIEVGNFRRLMRNRGVYTQEDRNLFPQSRAELDQIKPDESAEAHLVADYITAVVNENDKAKALLRQQVDALAIVNSHYQRSELIQHDKALQQEQAALYKRGFRSEYEVKHDITATTRLIIEAQKNEDLRSFLSQRGMQLIDRYQENVASSATDELMANAEQLAQFAELWKLNQALPSEEPRIAWLIQQASDAISSSESGWANATLSVLRAAELNLEFTFTIESAMSTYGLRASENPAQWTQALQYFFRESQQSKNQPAESHRGANDGN